MRLPDHVRKRVKAILWKEADSLHWGGLSAAEKARRYEIWTETASIGGLLAAYMDPRRVRVYIKDTLLKDYMRERMSDPGRIFECLGLSLSEGIVEEFVKPHGRMLADHRVICWSRALDWKLTIIAVFERALIAPKGIPYAAVLIGSSARYSDDPAWRNVVETVSNKLGIERLVWLDN